MFEEPTQRAMSWRCSKKLCIWTVTVSTLLTMGADTARNLWFNSHSVSWLKVTNSWSNCNNYSACFMAHNCWRIENEWTNLAMSDKVDIRATYSN